MTNEFDFITTDWIITFAYYTKTTGDKYSKVSLGPEQQIVIEDCYFDSQAEEKFWTLTGNDYDNIWLIDTEEAEITIKDRTIEMQVVENDMTTPPLIGYLVLETMDFVIDTKAQQLIGNPEHDGQWVVDLL